MIAKYYGRSISLDHLRNKSQYGKQGVSMLSLADAAESIGLKSVGAKISFEQSVNDAPLPAILHWDQYHFVVLAPASKKNKLVIADPAKGLIKLQKENFKNVDTCNRERSGKRNQSLLESILSI
jgi:ATP-binding cassette subfamily B protein